MHLTSPSPVFEPLKCSLPIARKEQIAKILTKVGFPGPWKCSNTFSPFFGKLSFCLELLFYPQFDGLRRGLISYCLFGSDLLVDKAGMFTPKSMYLLVSSLWVPSIFQTCEAFSGLSGVWSGKGAKVFPGKRARLSGDSTGGALLRIPSGTPPAYPQPGVGETPAAETQWPTPSWP